MRVITLTLASLGAMLFSSMATAADAPARPPGKPPILALASASEKDGKVVVQIAQARVRFAPPAADGGGGTDIVWNNLKPVTLGETVQAYNVDGTPAEPGAVLMALAEETGVAVFVRLFDFDPAEPPEFYLSLLRKGTIVLVVKAEDVADPIPMP
jgi:hypothetical protein